MKTNVNVGAVSNTLDADFAVSAQKSAKYRGLVDVAPIVNYATAGYAPDPA